ncbi:MAG: uncharacterized protein KVP18_002769 [Porospora cf. gigantea A]|uniref:uncharacterized protein n=1 Tax=Porospora cf. gigantea A TaxID=2853593 RepID=UPI00355A76C0|nr:MAG: hypothetical protein KVP18_002769 [Porospora cf. gigantea A]
MIIDFPTKRVDDSQDTLIMTVLAPLVARPKIHKRHMAKGNHRHFGRPLYYVTRRRRRRRRSKHPKHQRVPAPRAHFVRPAVTHDFPLLDDAFMGAPRREQNRNHPAGESGRTHGYWPSAPNRPPPYRPPVPAYSSAYMNPKQTNPVTPTTPKKVHFGPTTAIPQPPRPRAPRPGYTLPTRPAKSPIAPPSPGAATSAAATIHPNADFGGFTKGVGVRHAFDASQNPLPLGPFRAVTYFKHPKVVNKGNWLNVVGHLVNDLQAHKVPQYIDLPLHLLPKSDLKKLGTLIRYIPPAEPSGLDWIRSQ